MPQNNLEFWIDVNLPPVRAVWLRKGFGVSAKSFNQLNLGTEKDIVVFRSAVKGLILSLLLQKMLTSKIFQKK